MAHRVLIGTKSLQRRRTGVLLLFSYLQEEEAEVTGGAGAQRTCVMLWRHPGLSSVRSRQGIRSGNPLQPQNQLELLFYSTSTSLLHTLTPELTQGTAREAGRFGELLEGTLGLQSKSIH